MVESQGDVVAQEATDGLDKQRETNAGGIEPTGAESIAAQERLPILESPEGLWEAHMKALDAYQVLLVKNEDDAINSLRICKATVPLLVAPETYMGPHAGFPVIKGDQFSVVLSNGQEIHATKGEI